jgi:dTDP-4-dehydrorhamnose reductase
MPDQAKARPRVLLTGGTGLLALNWACAVRDTWDVVLGTHRHRAALKGTSSCRLNLDDQQELGRQVAEISPDLLVHTAGLTNVDECEANPELAREANATLARNLAEVAASRSIRLIHISTDHLFAGDRSCYREEDVVHPLNEYARSKLLAEEWVLQTCPQALVLRTNFFGWGHSRRQSFSDWIIYSLRSGKPLSLFDDVYFTPVLADHLARAAHELSERGASGIFHFAGDERTSKYDFALRLVECFALPAQLIHRANVQSAGLRARRPRDMSLDNSKARAVLKRNKMCLDEYLHGLHAQEMAGRRVELLHSVAS